MSGLEELLDSVASPQRLRMLRALKNRELSYTELLGNAGMDKVRDAGRFTYHLKKLLSTGLIESDENSRRYRLTQRGRLILEHLEKLEKELGSSAMMIVRRSQHLIEPFDRGKIAQALVREAGLTPKLADEVAFMAEEKLKGLKVGYLTASLIRELVNSILLDMGLEEYRHRLTRVGLPVYDVSRLLKIVEEAGTPWVFVEKAAGAVSKEYLLLNVLPRNVAESHLSGRIDLYSLGGWLTSLDGMMAEENLERLLWVRRELVVKNIQELKIIQKIVHPDVRIAFKVDEYKTLGKLGEIRRPGMLAMLDLSLGDTGKLSKVDEVVRRAGFKPVYYIGGRILPSGYGLDKGGAIHSAAALNIPSAVLESGRDPGETMEKVRENAQLAAQALSKAINLHRRLYGSRISSVVGLCGLYESARHLAGSPPSVSEEAKTIMEDIIEAAVQGIKRGCGNEPITLVAKSPRSAARRMVKIDSYRFGMKERIKFTGAERDEYSWTPIPPWEKFRSLDDRMMLEARILERFKGGYFMLFSKSRRHRILERICRMVDEVQGIGVSVSITFY